MRVNPAQSKKARGRAKSVEGIRPEGGVLPTGCDKACRVDQQCINRQCVCPTGLEDCEGRCVDVRNEAAHCGRCGRACEAGVFCAHGDCVAQCPASTPTLCFGGCVDTGRDAQHCGECGRVCKAGELCVEGSCQGFADGGEATPEAMTEVRPEEIAEVTPEIPAQPNEVLIPAGSFTMGSPTNELGRGSNETQYQVTLTRSFFMQKYEVTQSEFQARMGYNPSHFSSCGGNCPVERVTWHEAAAYSNAVSRAAGLPECFTCTGSGTSVACEVAAAYTGANYYNCLGYRLPTEAEWEYAYRAGTTTAFYNGGITNTSCSPLDANADAIAWYCGNAQSKTHPVGGKQPNAWGLYDMAGNVWEWCYDWFGTYPTQAATDPVGAATGTARVRRGGGWDYLADVVRAAQRSVSTPTSRYYSVGFRVVRSSP